MKEFIVTALKGFAMGAANVIPGVSGGTIAFITGIYERLITALKSFDLQALRMVFRGEFKQVFAKLDLIFLIALGVGAVISIASLAKILSWGFEEHPLLIWAFFFGLIASSIPLVGKMVTHWSPTVIALGLIGCGLAVSLVFLKPAQENTDVFYLGFCGIIAMCSMIIPGLSGSFVLVLMGNYQLIMLESVSALTSFDFAKALPILIPVGIGAIVGLIVLSRLLSWLFKNYHNQAIALITGFILGSLAIIWPWKEEIPARSDTGQILIKTAERTLEARPGTLAEVKAAKGSEEELVIEGYGNWHGPNLSNGSDWAAFGFIIAGAFLILLIEWSARRGQQTT